MKFGESLCTGGDGEEALDRAIEEALAPLGGSSVDLAFLFSSRHFLPAAPSLLRRLSERIGARRILGCSAQSVIGGGREVEEAPALSLFTAHLPDTELVPFHIGVVKTPEGHCFPVDPPGVLESAGPESSVLLLGEPFSMPIDLILKRLNEDHPGLPVVGGMASGGGGPGQNLLFKGDKVVRSGAVGLLLTGPLRLRSMVSQGCRPIGARFIVTEREKNALLKLGGRPALTCVREMLAELDPIDRALFQAAPHLGIAMEETLAAREPGDFLVRNIVGADPRRGAVFINGLVRRGQSVRFHVRDRHTARADLTQLMEQERVREDSRILAGLMFNCNGRGFRLYERPDQDIRIVRDALGEIPISGFFGRGEVGPVGEKNHLHGFTACMALFAQPV